MCVNVFVTASPEYPCESLGEIGITVTSADGRVQDLHDCPVYVRAVCKDSPAASHAEYAPLLHVEPVTRKAVSPRKPSSDHDGPVAPESDIHQHNKARRKRPWSSTGARLHNWVLYNDSEGRGLVEDKEDEQEEQARKSRHSKHASSGSRRSSSSSVRTGKMIGKFRHDFRTRKTTHTQSSPTHTAAQRREVYRPPSRASFTSRRYQRPQSAYAAT